LRAGVGEDGIDDVQVVDAHERRERVGGEKTRCVSVYVHLRAPKLKTMRLE